MDDIASFIIRAVVGLIDGMVGIFGLLNWAERHTSQSSRVGESDFEREARSWWERAIDLWYWLVPALLIIAALIGGTIWWF